MCNKTIILYYNIKRVLNDILGRIKCISHNAPQKLTTAACFIYSTQCVPKNYISTSLSYTIYLEIVPSAAECPQKHGGFRNQ